ncbi:hypothetical protein AURDEDRAFT_129242 [Auricularia subglabra TFB-10046 SS5]|nr:hypothetical protein AURDEDRAFT_129242 [Auricularia subglabra TFB-10046 SS5]
MVHSSRICFSPAPPVEPPWQRSIPTYLLNKRSQIPALGFKGVEVSALPAAQRAYADDSHEVGRDEELSAEAACLPAMIGVAQQAYTRRPRMRAAAIEKMTWRANEQDVTAKKGNRERTVGDQCTGDKENTRKKAGDEKHVVPKPAGQLVRQNRNGYILSEALGWSEQLYNDVGACINELCATHLNPARTYAKQTKEKIDLICQLVRAL